MVRNPWRLSADFFFHPAMGGAKALPVHSLLNVRPGPHLFLFVIFFKLVNTQARNKNNMSNNGQMIV